MREYPLEEIIDCCNRLNEKYKTDWYNSVVGWKVAPYKDNVGLSYQNIPKDCDWAEYMAKNYFFAGCTREWVLKNWHLYYWKKD
jgi:hypothetical protein